MSNIGGPISPTENLTFELNRLMRISEGERCGGGGIGDDFLSGSNTNSNNDSGNVSQRTSPSPATTTANSHTISHVAANNNQNNDNATATAAGIDNNGMSQQSTNDMMMTMSVTATSGVATGLSTSNNQNNNNTMIKTAALPIAPSAPVIFTAMLQSVQSEPPQWGRVAALCENFAAAVVSRPELRVSQQHRAAKHQLVDLVQSEFEASFQSKNIKRREHSLLIVAHLFAANALVSEKVVVAAIYRALGIDQPGVTSSSHSPPLYALLAVARALNLVSSHFKDVGLQHLGSLVTTLCAGLVSATPSESQHSELCEAIRVNSAVLHGFRGSTTPSNA